MSASNVDRLIRRGVLVRRHAGVYRLGDDLADDDTDLMTSILSAGRNAVAASRTAASIWDMPVERPDRPQIVVPRSRKGLSVPGAVVRTTRRAVRADAAVRGGIPVTSVSRTLVDIAEEVEDAVLSESIASMLRSGMVTLVRLRHQCSLLRCSARPWLARVERVIEALEISSRPTESVLEEEFARLIDESDLPPPQYQYSLRSDDGWLRLDAAYPEIRLGIEIDGFVWHSSPSQVTSDRHRSNLLAALGWTMLHFTSHDIAERPDAVVAEIGGLYGRLRHLGSKACM